MQETTYGKIIAKVPAEAAPLFTAKGYRCEAEIPGYYGGERKGLFMAKYPIPERRKVADPHRIESHLKRLKAMTQVPLAPMPAHFHLRILAETDIDAMIHLYKRVFTSYPFPIHDRRFIERTMRESVIYFGIFIEGTLAAVSSCDINATARSAEMTDFAVYPAYRGQKLSRYLLEAMETLLNTEGIQTATTIARAVSLPMNATFAKAGYRFGGTLYNNTHISGEIESMNVWYKRIHKRRAGHLQTS
jgi:putative beta-lysine N-acetyltransferase